MHDGGHVWQGGMHGRGMHAPQQILQDTVNERAVRILLECIPLVAQEANCPNITLLCGGNN